MKKLPLVIFLVIIPFTVFSQNQNGWLSLGINWGNQWETSGEGKIKTYMDSFGLDISSYTFQNDKDIGFFTHTSFYFPLTSTIESAGIGIKVNLSDSYDFIIGLDGIIGFGFKKNINERILFNIGVGPDLGLLFATSDNTRLLSFILGIGAPVGLKYEITHLLCISIGATIAYSFLCYTTGSNTIIGEFSGWASNYSLFSIKPYICLSLNRYYDSQNRQHWGKLSQ